MYCFHCQYEIASTTKIFRQTTCEQCGSYLHCCMNCEYYDLKAYNQCREPSAERVLDKEKANFCDFFSPNQSAPRKDQRAEEARRKLEALFKKKND